MRQVLETINLKMKQIQTDSSLLLEIGEGRIFFKIAFKIKEMVLEDGPSAPSF